MLSNIYKRRKLRRKADRRGATAVEFALIAPMLFLFFLALLEWGRFEMIRQASSSAAFNAARHGTLPGATDTETAQIAKNFLSLYFITEADVTTTFDEESTTVFISVPVGPNSFVLNRFFGDCVLEREFTLDVR